LSLEQHQCCASSVAHRGRHRNLSLGLCDCRAILHLLKEDIKPRDIMTRAAFENAMVIIMALGGSTNAVLHLLAMAHAVGPCFTCHFTLVSRI
jgi:dihydroxyacid dehydratase/phosphogluconate dehydratase